MSIGKEKLSIPFSDYFSQNGKFPRTENPELFFRSLQPFAYYQVLLMTQKNAAAKNLLTKD
jgi:hypothetical protein